MTAILIDHRMIRQYVEIVTVNGQKTYVVDRKREELRNIADPTDRLPEVQRQSGRTPSGGLELLVLYQSETDENEKVVLDSSPEWLEEIQYRFLQTSDHE